VIDEKQRRIDEILIYVDSVKKRKMELALNKAKLLSQVD